MLCLLYILQQKSFNLLYFINKTEHFSFKSGYAVRVVKLMEELAYSGNFGFKQLYTTSKSYITKVLEYKSNLN